MDRKIVIIPTYNEKENIEAIVRKVFSLEGEYHILIIDDGSPDGTAGIVKGLQGEFPERLHLLEREGKLGLGTAYLTGFKWCLDKGYDYIFEMDADFSHDPERSDLSFSSLEDSLSHFDDAESASLDSFSRTCSSPLHDRD